MTTDCTPDLMNDGSPWDSDLTTEDNTMTVYATTLDGCRDFTTDEGAAHAAGTFAARFARRTLGRSFAVGTLREKGRDMDGSSVHYTASLGYPLKGTNGIWSIDSHIRFTVRRVLPREKREIMPRPAQIPSSVSTLGDLTMTVTRKITVPAEEVDFFASLFIGGDDHSGDMLLSGFSGYWLCGLKHYGDGNPEGSRAGWLCWDEYADQAEECPIDEIIAAYEAGEDLPARCYFIDRAIALKVLKLGVAEWGTDFYDGGSDYGDIDSKLQIVLLGEVTYG